MILASLNANQGSVSTSTEHIDIGIVKDVVNVCGFALKMTNVFMQMILASIDADQSSVSTSTEHIDIKIVCNIVNICGLALKATNVLRKQYLPASTPTRDASSRVLSTSTLRSFAML
jgi:hypothetical protein